MNTLAQDLLYVAPEFLVGAMACVVLLADVFVSAERRQTIGFLLTVATLIGAMVLSLLIQPAEPVVAFGGQFVLDGLATLVKIVTYLAVILVLVYSQHYLREWDIAKGEYLVLVLIATLGMLVMASGGSLLTIYLGLEMLSLALYALVAFRRDSALASEAAMKYFVLGAMASGMLLYGMSLMYGMTTSLDLQTIALAIADTSSDGEGLVLKMALVFVLIGLAFKLGAVPFHMWLPDVYHGAPASVTLFVGTAPKLAALAITLRLLADGFGSLHEQWQGMLVLLAVLSLLVGNVIAIAQQNIKRMLAYSTIGHVGFILLGLLTGTTEGYSAALFYTVIYTLMGLGAFGVVVILSRNGTEAEDLMDFKGLAERNVWLAMLMALIMFSMAGIPPTVGFYAKLAVLRPLLDVGYTWLALLAVVLSVVGAFYYLRVIKLMFMDETDSERVHAPAGWGNWAAVLLSINGLAMVLLGLFPGWLMQVCHQAMVS
mgnify:CR=1 FL=1